MATVEWEVLDTGVSCAQSNMDQDAELLSQLGERVSPLIHFYDWEGKCATYGLLVNPEQFLDMEAVHEQGVTLARRPTGGGIVFHIRDLAFSVLVPAKSPLFSKNTLENYALINNAVLGAVQEFLQKATDLKLTPQDGPAWEKAAARFCMARPTKYDVVVGGRKVAGAAQRKTKKGFLHQGTIALGMPDAGLLSALLPKDSHILAAMVQSTFPLLPVESSQQEQSVAKENLKHLLTKHLKQGRL